MNDDRRENGADPVEVQDKSDRAGVAPVALKSVPPTLDSITKKEFSSADAEKPAAPPPPPAPTPPTPDSITAPLREGNPPPPVQK